MRTLLLASDLDHTMVQNEDPTHKRLLAFDHSWLANGAASSGQKLLVFSTGRSPELFKQLWHEAPLITPGEHVWEELVFIVLTGWADGGHANSQCESAPFLLGTRMPPPQHLFCSLPGEPDVQGYPYVLICSVGSEIFYNTASPVLRTLLEASPQQQQATPTPAPFGTPQGPEFQPDGSWEAFLDVGWDRSKAQAIVAEHFPLLKPQAHVFAFAAGCLRTAIPQSQLFTRPQRIAGGQGGGFTAHGAAAEGAEGGQRHQC
eukprot:1161468-Pelagomonas_calceolata.AAC.3